MNAAQKLSAALLLGGVACSGLGQAGEIPAGADTVQKLEQRLDDMQQQLAAMKQQIQQLKAQNEALSSAQQLTGVVVTLSGGAGSISGTARLSSNGAAVGGVTELLTRD